MFLDDLGAQVSLERRIAASYRILGLRSCLTAGPAESRAGRIRVGTKAPQAAGRFTATLSVDSSAPVVNSTTT